MARLASSIGLAAIVAVAAASACDDGKKPAPTPPTSKGPVGPPPYRVDTMAPAAPCSAGAPCAITLRLTALRDFHVNTEYPFKFLGDAELAVELDGTGDFALLEAKTGTLTVRFRARAAGTARVTGLFKLSVCNEGSCHIESAPVSVDVPIS